MKKCKVTECNVEIASNRQYCDECKINVRRAKQRARSAKMNSKDRLCINLNCQNVLSKGKHKYCSSACRPTKRLYASERNKKIIDEASKNGTLKTLYKNHEDKLLMEKIERDKKKHKGTIDPKWLVRGPISLTKKGTTLEGGFTYD